MAGKLPMLDAFAGIGGFSQALKSAFRTVLYCEIDPACQCVLRRLMARKSLTKAPLHADVRDLVVATYDLASPPVMLTAGSPCVDLSSLQRNAAGTAWRLARSCCRCCPSGDTIGPSREHLV